MIRTLMTTAAVAWLVLVAANPAVAQRSLADVLGQATPEGKPKTFLDEVTLFSYIENSFVGNLRGTGRGDVNELRLYDLDGGYTFNMAEFSIKKDPSDAPSVRVRAVHHGRRGRAQEPRARHLPRRR